jgi:hypothetical protein
MAMAWLGSADDEADSVTSTELVPSELEPLDYKILTLLFEGTKPIAICASLTLTRAEYDARVSRPSFTDLTRRVEKGMIERLTTRGDFEPITAARTEAPAAMKRVIQQSRLERDPKVRLAANKEVLRFAGVEPARRVEVTTPDKVLDQMTPEELALFAAHRKWPSRFREALRAFIPSDQVGDGSDQKAIDVTPRKLAPPEAPPDSTLPPVPDDEIREEIVAARGPAKPAPSPET